MDIDRIKALITKREEIDREIREAVSGGEKERKAIACSICGGAHTARTCPQKPAPTNGNGAVE